MSSADDALPIRARGMNLHTVIGQDNARMIIGDVHGNVSFPSSEDPQDHRSKELRKCRNALFLTDPAIDRASLISAKGKRVAGTCEWIRENDKYRSWLDGSLPLLWISGGPGKGKTMMSVFLSEELQQNKKEIYYFCSNDDGKRNNAAAVLRGLLWKMTLGRPDLAKHLIPYFETPEMTQTSLSSAETLWTMFVKICHDPDVGTVTCVLDGLDECDEDSQTWLVNKLVDLTQLANTDLRTTALKLAIVSRNILGMGQSARVKLDPDHDDEVSADIRKFVSNKVRALSGVTGFDDDFSQSIERELLTRAEGTFLWVGFAMLELVKKRTRLEVEDALRSLPEGLPAIYDRMILQIEPTYQRACSAILVWVTMAARPLKVRELAAAVTGEPDLHIDTERAVRDLLELCSPLIKVQGERASLVHQSARDYLLRSRVDDNIRLEQFRVKPEEAHLRMAQICLMCIEASALQHTTVRYTVLGKNLLGDSELLQYAMRYWPEHARGASSTTEQLYEQHSSFFFDEKSQVRKNWWYGYRDLNGFHWLSNNPPILVLACQLRCFPWIQALFPKSKLSFVSAIIANIKDLGDGGINGCCAVHIAAREGHEAVVRLLLERGAVLNATNNHGQSELHLAATSGHEVIVRLLLDHGAKINKEDSPSNFTPLHRAANKGHEAVVRLLIARGANVKARSSLGSMPLHLATMGGRNGAVTRLLLDNGAPVNATRHDLSTPLHLAAAAGDDAVVRLLLDHGADVNAIRRDHDTPLLLAAEAGNAPVARMLLKNGADVNAVNDHDCTPLYYAVYHGYGAIVDALLDKGVIIDSADGMLYTTMLHRAVQEGYEAVIRLLLDKGGDINAMRDETGTRTPLHIALDAGNETVIQLLVEKGADVNATTTHRRTPLQLAAFRESEFVVRILLNAGANINAKDGNSRTPLHFAAIRGNNAMVQLLLTKGAEVDAKDESCRTPLHLAVAGGSEVVAKYLLDKGADIEAVDVNCRTPLHLAANKGSSAVAELS